MRCYLGTVTADEVQMAAVSMGSRQTGKATVVVKSELSGWEPSFCDLPVLGLSLNL